jgi:hypothetical protein
VIDSFENIFVDDVETESKGYIAGVLFFGFLISPLTRRLQVIGNRPLKQECQPEDIASIVSYLTSKEAHFITCEFPSVVVDRMWLIHTML